MVKFWKMSVEKGLKHLDEQIEDFREWITNGIDTSYHEGMETVRKHSMVAGATKMLNIFETIRIIQEEVLKACQS